MPKSIRKTKNNKGGKAASIYLDHAASAEPNPSSIHRLGLEARKKLEQTRREVAGILRARPEEIIFTSGGTESNNMAIQGSVFAALNFFKIPHIVTTNIEHPSVLETCRLLERRSLAEVTVVPVETSGIVDPRKISKAIKKNTVLVSVMYANNEIGTIQPIREIAKGIRYYRKTKVRPSGNEGLTFVNYPYFHTDAVQAPNYLDLSVEKLGVDLLTLSGSKISGAGRVGVLYRKKSVSLENLFGGGDQEGGLRPGTENVAAILKFSETLAQIEKIKFKEAKRLKSLQDYLFKKLKKFNPIINGDTENRLPNNVSVTFPGIPSDLLVIELSARGIMCSAKSACKSGSAEGSYVIKALRPDADPEIDGLRFSLGANTTKGHLDLLIKALEQIVEKLEKWYA